MQKHTEQKIVDTLEKNYMPYAMSVIVSRAIPEIDGLKPSHRKLLFTMYKMGLLTGAKTKSANVVGQTMKLNPHGDMAIYETLVRLTRGNAALLHPLIDSKGNFGKQYSRDMRFAAPRYTECKLDKLCEELFRDLDKNTVDFIDNYDGTIKEPRLLPATFPNILVNANQGIAVGMASNICSFNLQEICDVAVRLIQKEEINPADYINGPDFPSGGQLIYNRSDLEEILETGRGGFKVRAKYRYDKKINCIEIIEIPYTTTSEAIIDVIVDLVKSGKIREVNDIRDETDLDGLKITIDLKKNVDPDALMNKLYKVTQLCDSFSCNFNLLINGAPKVLGVREILNEWAKFRIESIKRQTLFDIEKKTEKLHLLLGLRKILLDIDKAVSIVKNTERDDEVVPNLMKGFDIDEIQATFVADIKLRNLNKEYILNKVSEVESLEKEIAELNDVYKSEAKVRRIIVKQLNEVAKKYGKPRKTEIVEEGAHQEVTEEHFIEDYNLKLFLTKENYLKKIPLVSLRANPEHKLKDDDEIAEEIETHNKADLLLFSNTGVVYKLRIYEINDVKASSLGDYLTNLLGLADKEQIISIVATDDYKGSMLFAFENGKIAKIDLKGYETKTNRKKLNNAYSTKSPIIKAMFLTEDIDLVAYSNIGKVLVFNTSSINLKSARSSQGVQVLKAKKNSIMNKIKKLEEVDFNSVSFYRTLNIPAVGHFLKDEDKVVNQLRLPID
ncbi:MAG: DNA topoisomerase (ATP-hydrolyzing) subunit A [Clostridia bacterium]